MASVVSYQQEYLDLHWHDRSSRAPESRRSELPDEFSRGVRVLHDKWGVGQVESTDPQGAVTVAFDAGRHVIAGHRLRRVLPVTVLARVIESSSEVKAWAVRKANEQGRIRPDTIGRFAGHRVHYYVAARIPELIRELSEPDAWSPGTWVLHSRYGPGRIESYTAHAGESLHSAGRVVDFFRDGCSVVTSIHELRRLVPSHTIARHIQVNRRSFSKLAARRGIYPDYVAPVGRVREFYDESRAGEIRTRWMFLQPDDGPSLGSVVADADGEVARITARDACGRARISYVHGPTPTYPAEIDSLRELVSLRELARNEHMSRYRLNRLLNAMGITPVHRHGTTLCFDRVAAHEAVQARVRRERRAVSLATLSERTGVSEAILARKVRNGCIRTVPDYPAHVVDEKEAQRVEEVVRASKCGLQDLRSLGICRLHPRGARGAEVACWNLDRLLEIAGGTPENQRSVLFGQVAWMCEGSGRKRLQDALREWFRRIRSTPDRPQVFREARLLLEFVTVLPGGFEGDRIRLLLIGRAGTETWRSMEDGITSLARQTGCDNQRAFERFQTCLDQSLTLLLNAYSSGQSILPVPPRTTEDEFAEGAILASVFDGKPEAGVIVRIEQQCWDAMARRHHKTMLVRFADTERRITTYTASAAAKQRSSSKTAQVLLGASEVATLVRLLGTAAPHGTPRGTFV